MSEKFKVVFDPMLFDLSLNYDKDEQFYYLQNLVGFITTHCNIEFDTFEYAPYISEERVLPPYSSYDYPELGKIMQIKNKIFKYISTDELSFPSKKIIELKDDLNEHSNVEQENAMLKYIEFLIRNSKDFILMMGIPNHRLSKPLRFQIDNTPFTIDQIDDPKKDYKSNFYRTLIFDKKNSNKYFPNADTCCQMNEVYKTAKDSVSIDCQRVLIENIGREVALRNGYSEDSKLSEINTRKTKNDAKRTIFKRNYRANKYFYLSIDYESGGLEVYENDASHQGQFRFDCTKIDVKNANTKTHPLYLK